MKNPSRVFIRLLTAGAVALSASAVNFIGNSSAEDQPNPSSQTTAPVELLFVQNGTSGTFDGKTLTLKGVGSTIYFSDRPYRIAGQVRTSEFISHWDKGSDNFQENPPNATLSIFGTDQVDSAVVELTSPYHKGDVLSYQAKVLEGSLPAHFKESSLFIDIFGRWRMAAYGHAAGVAEGVAMGAAAASSHAAYAPPPPPPQPAPVYTAPVAAPPPAQVNVTVTPASSAAHPAGTPATTSVTSNQAAAIAKLKELKGLLSQGLITQAQYQEESQKLLNEIMQ